MIVDESTVDVLGVAVVTRGNVCAVTVRIFHELELAMDGRVWTGNARQRRAKKLKTAHIVAGRVQIEQPLWDLKRALPRFLQKDELFRGQ